MIKASCHCGAITLEIDVPPKEVTECNCSICRRYGVLWAYYALAQVRIPSAAPTQVYLWDDRAIEFHRCQTCGCISHWSPVDRAIGHMGVNARLMPPELLAQARLRHLDAANTEQYLD
jgi:hypothetical protein